MYQLMNKDRVVATFDIIGEGAMEEFINIVILEELPFWINDIEVWVTERNAAKHRKHIKELLEQCNAETPSGFIALTHCLSLNDTLWVRKDSECISWSNVSLYRNDFDEVVSRLSFDGNGLGGIELSTTSPELTTDGAFDKCWLRENNVVYLLKVGSSGFSNAGMEPYSECLASQVYNCLLGEQSVSYSLVRYDGRIASKCKSFSTEAVGYKNAAVCGLNNFKLPRLLAAYDTYGDIDTFRRMCVGDAITCNSDRHYGNFGFVVNNDTYEKVGISPVFDYNMAFVPYADWYRGFTDMDAYLKDAAPRFGGTYVELAQSVLTSNIRSELINMKSLDLMVECDDKFTEERVALINHLKDVQIDRILGNRRQFSFSDIHRKYSLDVSKKSSFGSLVNKAKQQ